MKLGILLVRILSKKGVAACVLALVCGTVLSNLIGGEVVIIYGNFAYFPIAVFMTFVSVLSLRIHISNPSTHRTAWVMFSIFAIMWAVADFVWTAEEMAYHVDPFPSYADVFFFAGYVFLLLFLVLYIKPASSGISKSMVAVACVCSAALLLFGVVHSLSLDGFGHGHDTLYDEDYVSLGYFIADGIVIGPCIVGIMLYAGGRVNRIFCLLFLGIMLSYLGDVLFSDLQLHDTYYTGHYVELLFLLSNLFLAFGVLYNIKIFGNASDGGCDSKAFVPCARNHNNKTRKRMRKD